MYGITGTTNNFMIDPLQDWANGGIAGPIVDPATYDPGTPWSEQIDWGSVGGPTPQTNYHILDSPGSSSGGGFTIGGFNIFAVVAFLAGLILIFKWK